MPLINSDFRSPWWMFNGHLQTQLPVLLRRIKLTPRSICIPTHDKDQLSGNLYLKDKQPQKSLLIISHGLEGSNQQPYVLGMAQAALHEGIAGKSVDVLTWICVAAAILITPHFVYISLVLRKILMM